MLPLLDRLIDQVATPELGASFGTPKSVGQRAHLVLMLEGRARLGPLHPLQAALSNALRSYESSDSLPPSEIDPESGRGVDVPRGCALAWTVGMRGLYDPEGARALYAQFRRDFLIPVGPWIGFRE